MRGGKGADDFHFSGLRVQRYRCQRVLRRLPIGALGDQEFQFELTQNANRHLKTPLETRDGKLVVPQGPGLGVEVDEEAVAASSVARWTVE